MITLDNAENHKVYLIKDVLEKSYFSQRYCDLGICPGEHATIVGRAPFGGPFIVSIAGHKVALRASEASYVLVEEAPE